MYKFHGVFKLYECTITLYFENIFHFGCEGPGWTDKLKGTKYQTLFFVGDGKLFNF